MAEEGHPHATISRGKLFVGNISYRITRRELRSFFSEFGEVQSCRIEKDHRRKLSRGFGFVTFKKTETATAVLSLSGSKLCLDGRELRVAKAETAKTLRLKQTRTAGEERKSKLDRKSISEEEEKEFAHDYALLNICSEVHGNSVSSPDRAFTDQCSRCGQTCSQSAKELGTCGLKREEDTHQAETTCSNCEIVVSPCAEKDFDRTDNIAVNKSGCSEVVDLHGDDWLLVFSYLKIADLARIERVCRRWRDLVLISWRSIRRLSFETTFQSIFRGGCHQLTDSLLHVFLRRCGTGLLSLDLSFARHCLTTYALDLVGLYCGSLQELNLSKVALTQKTLKTLAERLHGLRSINLQGCNKVGEAGLWWALKFLRSLRSLTVADNRRISGQFFFQAPQSLTEVYAANCHHMTDKGVCLLSERCPNLETIDISNCFKLTGQTVTALTKNCRKLKRFMFGSYGNKNVLAGHFLTLSHLPLLEVVQLDRHTAVTDEVLHGLGQHCPQLRSLSCEACHELTDAAVAHLSPCLRLEHIVLSYCDHITDKGLLWLSSSHCELKKLVLRACQGITDKGVGHLSSAHPDLRELDVSGCISVTDAVLPVLQETVCFLRQEHAGPLSIVLGGTLVDPEKAIAFGEKTRSKVSLFDLSISQLCIDYDPYVRLPPYFAENEEDLLAEEPSNAQVKKLEYDVPEDDDCWDEDDCPGPSVHVQVEGGGFLDEEVYSGEDDLEDYMFEDDPEYDSDDFDFG